MNLEAITIRELQDHARQYRIAVEQGNIELQRKANAMELFKGHKVTALKFYRLYRQMKSKEDN